MTPESAMAANRFLHDSSLGLLWGGLGYASFVAKRPLAGTLVQRLDPMVSFCVVVVVVTTASGFLISAANATGVWSSVFDPETLHLMAETEVGPAFAIQAATAVALVVSTLLKAYRTSVVVTGLMLGELALRGHATEGSGLASLSHQGTDIVHVLSGTAWLGALVPFIHLLRLSSVLDLRTAALESLKRFSLAGHVAVALVLVSGLFNTWLVHGRIWPDLSSRYDQELLLKVLAVGLMVILAIVNRYFFVPMFGTNAARARTCLLYGSLTEIFLGLVALGLLASFGLQDPV